MVVTIYVYNRQKKFYFNKIIKVAINDLVKNSTLIKKRSKIKSKVKKQKKLALKTLGPFPHCHEKKIEVKLYKLRGVN